MPIRLRKAFVAKLTCILLLPFVIGSGAYQMALLVPGQIRIDYWQNFVSLTLIFSGAFAAYLIMTTQMHFFIRAVPASLLACVYVFFAMLASSRPNCEEELTFIGQTLNSHRLSSCGVTPSHPLKRSTIGRLTWPRSGLVHFSIRGNASLPLVPDQLEPQAS